MTARSTLVSLRRRSSAERRVVAMLRGDDAVPAPARGPAAKVDLPRALSKSQALFFAELRRLADRNGMAVQQRGSPYINDHELRLLGWIAASQRVTGQCAMPGDAAFLAAIARCAGLLDGLGLHLAPITLYGARLRDGGSHRRGYGDAEAVLVGVD